MLKMLLAAITMLAPHLGPTYAAHYSRLIIREAQRQRIDPFLIAAIIHVETGKSWRASVRSSTHDFGLMQVHVSKNSYPRLLGSEEVLLHPGTNIKYGTRTLAMWRNYHRRNCGDSAHPFWSHYQWGYRVRDLAWTQKVTRLYNNLIGMFGQPSKEDLWAMF